MSERLNRKLNSLILLVYALSRDDRKEEIRGLFVLGLLAVLASIRIQQPVLNIVLNDRSYNVSPFLDITIFFGSAYAFFYGVRQVKRCDRQSIIIHD